jgi:ADP-ribose pyrophosphatase YjhB (NUDIX family)
VTTADPAAVRLIAVVVDSDHVLLVKNRDGGCWELPAGALQADEDILTGLRRNVGHATGLVVAVDRLTGLYTDRDAGLSLVFLTRHVVGQIQPGPRISVCQWFPLTAATQSMLPPWPAEQVLHALAGHRQPLIAHQASHAAGRLRVSR